MSEFYNKTLLITGACGVTSRTIVRALRRSPYFRHTRLIGTDVCDNPYGIYRQVNNIKTVFLNKWMGYTEGNVFSIDKNRFLQV